MHYRQHPRKPKALSRLSFLAHYKYQRPIDSLPSPPQNQDIVVLPGGREDRDVAEAILQLFGLKLCRRQGRPAHLVDCKPTGNPVKGKSGTAKSLAYSPAKDMLYVVHSLGPDHIRLMTVDGEGKLTAPMGGYLTGKNSTQGGDR